MKLDKVLSDMAAGGIRLSEPKLKRVPSGNDADLNHTKTSVTARHYARHQYEKEKLSVLKAWSDHLLILIDD